MQAYDAASHIEADYKAKHRVGGRAWLSSSRPILKLCPKGCTASQSSSTSLGNTFPTQAMAVLVCTVAAPVPRMWLHMAGLPTLQSDENLDPRHMAPQRHFLNGPP